MNKILHIKKEKKQRLVELITKIDRRRYHALYLCSCYFSQEAARILINEIRNNNIRLSFVNIYIDRREAIKHGRTKLEEFCNSFKSEGLEINLYAVENNTLFHSKSYTLIAFDESNNIVSGSIVLGSANLTVPGLTSQLGNIECLIDSQDISLLEEHMSQLDKLKKVSTDKLNTFSKKDEFSFKYALLQSGVFLHKWNDNLEQYLSIRYSLSEIGKTRTTDSSLKEIGFNIETATISKRYFRFDYNPSHLEKTKNIIRNFGIETNLGYWLPSIVTESIVDKNELDVFEKHLFSELKNQENEIERQMQSDLEYLQKNEFIENDVNPVDSFNKKIDDLKENELRLKRIYSKYDIFDLPYNIHEKDKILELFNEMIKVAESKTRKNKTAKALLESNDTFSIDDFNKVINS
jgi:hypothetical protein